VRATAVIVITGISLLLSGCGAAGTSGPPTRASQPRGTAAGRAPAQAPAAGGGSVRELAALVASRIRSGNAELLPDSVIKFQDKEYYATISNAQTARSFTAFATATRDIAVQPSSAARVIVVGYSPPKFVTPSERTRWQAAGRPPMPSVAVTGQAFSVPAGSYSFIPQGTPLTYRQARSLPGSPGALSAEVTTHLRPFAGAHPPPAVVLLQLGFLLATAPLPGSARAAAWSVLTALPGLHLCGLGRDLAGRAGQWVCASTRANEVEVLVDTATGSALAVDQRILQASSWFPGVPRGSLVESDTFTSGS
jgi:hypothetical protein